MSSQVVTEEQLRERLQRAGKSDDEIESLIDQYVRLADTVLPDTDAISKILQKSQEDSVLRVGRFNLTREQYDALLNYYEEESGKLIPGQQVDTNSLVREAIARFVDIIS